MCVIPKSMLTLAVQPIGPADSNALVLPIFRVACLVQIANVFLIRSDTFGPRPCVGMATLRLRKRRRVDFSSDGSPETPLTKALKACREDGDEVVAPDAPDASANGHTSAEATLEQVSA